MTIQFDLPPTIESSLREFGGDASRAAKEAVLVELYRLDQLSHRELSEALGLDRFETEALLKKHNVTEDFPTHDEYMRALRHLGVVVKT
jgi:hypothetical protein